MKKKKIPFFKRLINLINNKFISNDEMEQFADEKNLFNKYIEKEIELKEYEEDFDEKTNLNYIDIRTCAEYCNEALKLAKHRIEILSRSDKISEQLIELEYISNLTFDDVQKLNILCERHKNLINENNTLLYQLTGFNNSVIYFKKIHKEAEVSMGLIEEAEKMQRIFRNDINLLKYEKKDLSYENSKMKNAMEFINKLSISFVGIFSIIMLVLGYLNIFVNRPIFYEISTMVIFLIFFISLTYFFRLKINKELRINVKKQSKLTELINKKKTVYAYYTSFLDVEYEKYNSKNSKDLKYNIDEYKQYERISQRKDTAAKAYNETYREIERFIREKGIPCNTSIDVFVKNVSVEDRIRQHKKLLDSKNENDNLLEELDVKHNAYWTLIMELNEKDQSENKIINNLIEKYYEEVEKILIRMNVENTEGDDDEKATFYN